MAHALMGSATALSGRDGRFYVAGTQVARCTQWQVTPTMATSTEWGDSDSHGYTNRAAGRKDCTFTAEGKYDTTQEVFDLFQPGDIAAVQLWLDNVSLYWDIPRALCTNFQLTVNIDSGEVIGWTSDWGADGPYYYPGEPHLS